MTEKEKRLKVISNIKKRTQEKNFCGKVELDDPELSREEKDAIVKKYIKRRKTLSFKFKSSLARLTANFATKLLEKDVEIVGLEKLLEVTSGAIITSNHFNPLDSIPPRLIAKKMKKKRLNIVCEETNLAMTGFIGFLMNYADTIPITDNFHYMHRDFFSVIKDLAEKGEYILIYPEREMWYNYRKPRPTMEGAYYYCSKLKVPIIPLFVEIKNSEKAGKTTFVVHVLDPLYPDSNKSDRENCKTLHALDYNMKKEAYEKCYGKKLDYTFNSWDIAGFEEEKI